MRNKLIKNGTKILFPFIVFILSLTPRGIQYKSFIIDARFFNFGYPYYTFSIGQHVITKECAFFIYSGLYVNLVLILLYFIALLIFVRYTKNK